MFDLKFCHVERNIEQNYFIRWHGAHARQIIAVYMSANPDKFYAGGDFGAPVLYTKDQEALIVNPDVDERHYFYLETEAGEGAILAERQLSLQGTPNFRDLGGYKTQDGRRLKWGKLYRSSKLSALTDEDIGYIRRLGLTVICDFRQLTEQELEPTLLGENVSHTVASLPVSPGSSSNFMENLHRGVIAVDDSAGFMEEMNRDFVASQMPQYAQMFQLLLQGDQQLLIHCASGKDRTGFGAALILDVLGVSEETIVDDYLLTNNYLPIDDEVERLSKDFIDHAGEAVPKEVLRPMLEVRPEYIRACFEEIKNRYKSKQHFYESALHLNSHDVEKLKDLYLE